MQQLDDKLTDRWCKADGEHKRAAALVEQARSIDKRVDELEAFLEVKKT